MVIHASKTWDQRGYEFLTEQMDEYVPSRYFHVFGALQGVVSFVDLVTSRDELTPPQRRWFFGDVGLVFEDAKEFKKPILWRGQVGIFSVPDNVLKTPEKCDHFKHKRCSGKYLICDVCGYTEKIGGLL